LPGAIIAYLSCDANWIACWGAFQSWGRTILKARKIRHEFHESNRKDARAQRKYEKLGVLCVLAVKKHLLAAQISGNSCNSWQKKTRPKSEMHPNSGGLFCLTEGATTYSGCGYASTDAPPGRGRCFCLLGCFWQRGNNRMEADELVRLYESGKRDFQGVELNDADLSGFNLSEADLSRADLSEANLSDADLSEANLSDANLSEAILIMADLSRANLSGADLSEALLIGAHLSRANLSGADLSLADLSGADLSRANLGQASLIGAFLSEASLDEADLSKANLKAADLSKADLCRADLSEAEVTDEQLAHACLITGATMPDGAKHD